MSSPRAIYFRVLFIRWNSIILRIGPETFVRVSKWSVFILSLLFTLAHLTEYFFILNPSSMVYFGYFTQLTTKVQDLEGISDYVVCAACLVANVMESLCFLVIIHEFYQFHRSRAALSDTESHLISRTKKNAITATGHFFSFLTEMFLFGVGQSVLMSQKELLGFYHWIFFMLLPGINYAVFPVVQTLATPDLRHNIKLPDVKGTVAKFVRTFCTCGCTDAVSTELGPNFDIEMNFANNNYL